LSCRNGTHCFLASLYHSKILCTLNQFSTSVSKSRDKRTAPQALHPNASTNRSSLSSLKTIVSSLSAKRMPARIDVPHSGQRMLRTAGSVDSACSSSSVSGSSVPGSGLSKGTPPLCSSVYSTSTIRRSSLSDICDIRSCNWFSSSSGNISWPSSALHLRSLLDRINDLHIAGASAQIARDCFFYLIARRISVLVQQRMRGDQHARRADTALRASTLEKRLLKRIEAAVTSETFDGKNCRAVHLANRYETGVDDFAVDDHRASAALSFTATFFRSSQAQVFAKHIKQPLHGRRLNRSIDGIHFEAEGHMEPQMNTDIVARRFVATMS